MNPRAAKIGAGDRNVRVRFERVDVTTDEEGNELSGWYPHATAWAMVRYGNSAERREAAQTTATMAATITVLASSRTRVLTTRDRAIIAGQVWDIAGVALMPDRAHVAITAMQGPVAALGQAQ